MNIESENNTTHFGYKDIPEAEKPGKVHAVFTSVANQYDLMNDLMSGGVHRLWKETALDWLAPYPGMRLLDVAGGTGDISFRFLKRIHGQGQATICDFTEDMLHAGRERAEATEYPEALNWVCGDAMNLPFPDNSFDAYTISFGIRNITRIENALAEAYRVLRPGGRFLCLEFSTVTLPVLDRLYDLHSFNVIPPIGQMVTGDRESYQYLVESIRRFPDQEQFKTMIETAGFSRVNYRNLTGGIAAMHSGWRL